MKRPWIMAAGLACGLLAMIGGLQAAPLDTRIPQDAVVYVGWAGADTQAGKYADSNLKGVIDNTKIGDYVKANWAGWMEKAQARNEDAGKDIEEGVSALNLAWRHPTALYLGPVGLADIKKPTFKMAVLCDAGADAPA